jgi:hypothetical protein
MITIIQHSATDRKGSSSSELERLGSVLWQPPAPDRFFSSGAEVYMTGSANGLPRTESRR